MRYIVDVPSHLAERIRKLIESGEYVDLQEFVRVAIENQLHLQELPQGPVTEGEAADQPLHNQHLSSLLTNLPLNLLAIPARELPTLLNPQKPSSITIWGLYNRVFPAKVAIRVMYNLAALRASPSIDLKEVQSEASRSARQLGTELSYLDAKARKLHGEKMATGLPLGSRDRSTLRYEEMFVGTLGKDDTPQGLPAELGFAALIREKGKAVIGLTELGARFAKFQNPILDMEHDHQDSIFSNEEAGFLISNIKDRLPEEWSRCVAVLRAIEHGKNTPKAIETALISSKRDSDAAPTERAGILSRLTETGLIKRRRDGLNVSYSITEKGSEWT